jgi:hypothetical protein
VVSKEKKSFIRLVKVVRYKHRFWVDADSPGKPIKSQDLSTIYTSVFRCKNACGTVQCCAGLSSLAVEQLNGPEAGLLNI